MKVILVLLAFCLCFVSTSVQACTISLGSDKSLADMSYFIGLVKAQYIQQFQDGKFKEAGFMPFAVYKSAPDIDFHKMIVVTGDGSGCENYNARQGELVEIMVMKYGDQFKLKNLEFSQDVINELRQKMRYVGEE